MTSNLYWRRGFGWLSISLFILFVVGAISFSGVAKWIFAFFAAMSLVYFYQRNKRWNGSPWRQVHFRAMLLYAGLIGKEMSISNDQETAVTNACRQLAYRLVGYGRQLEADELIDEILFNDDLLKSFGFGPQLVIAGVIKNTYGNAELIKYILALENGEAK